MQGKDGRGEQRSPRKRGKKKACRDFTDAVPGGSADTHTYMYLHIGLSSVSKSLVALAKILGLLSAPRSSKCLRLSGERPLFCDVLIRQLMPAHASSKRMSKTRVPHLQRREGSHMESAVPEPLSPTATETKGGRIKAPKRGLA